MELHHDKHHAGYVKGANETLEKAREMRGKGDLSLVSMLEKNLAFHVSGHVLHSLFRTNHQPERRRPERRPRRPPRRHLRRCRRVPPADARGGSNAPGIGLGARLLGSGGWYLQYANRKTELFDAIWNVVSLGRRHPSARPCHRDGRTPPGMQSSWSSFWLILSRPVGIVAYSGCLRASSQTGPPRSTRPGRIRPEGPLQLPA